MYPDAMICEPPIDLTLKCHENPYTVESCELKVPNQTSSDSGADNSNIAIIKPERTMQANNQEPSSSIAPASSICLSADIESNAFERSVRTSAESEVKSYSRRTFDSLPDFADACAKMRSRGLEPLEPPSNRREVEERMNRYKQEIPWCLTPELDIHCLVLNVPTRSQVHFIEIIKNGFENLACIFIKPIPGEIWIGFPDEIFCKAYKRVFIRVLSSLPSLSVVMARPSKELLESISFPDLFHEAYDLALIAK
uniref:Uncharacterized protein n=1 Tax=Tetranychus urticae TaxID=32264 RepID=T1KGL5_TETUR